MTDWLSTVPAHFPSRFFISYSSLDTEMATSVHDGLVQAGHQVWRDRTSLRVGDVWRNEVTFGIQNSDEIVALLTPSSAQSDPVRFEIQQALADNKRINLFATFDPKSDPNLYSLVADINYLVASNFSGHEILNNLLAANPTKHPSGIREFEWRASRTIFPTFSDLLVHQRINAELASHYIGFASVFSRAPHRANAPIWINLALCAAALHDYQSASTYLDLASTRLHHPTLQYFESLLRLKNTRPRYLSHAQLDACIRLAESSLTMRKSPLTALLLCVLLSDGRRAIGPNLVKLCQEALAAIASIESEKGEIRRFLFHVPFSQELILPVSADSALYAFRSALGE